MAALPRPEATENEHTYGSSNLDLGNERFYAPQTGANKSTYDYHLDRLGFKPRTNQRKAFRSIFILYHDQPHRKYLVKEDGDNFKALVNDFLKRYGAEYFGKHQRSHLVMSDTTVGLLYPRDAENEDAYLWKTLADCFHWRSSCVRSGHSTRAALAKSDGSLPSAESSGGKVSEDDISQRVTRSSSREIRKRHEQPVTDKRDQAYPRGRGKRRGRPPLGQRVSDGHQAGQPEAQDQIQGHRRGRTNRRGRPPLRQGFSDGHQHGPPVVEDQTQGQLRGSTNRRGRPFLRRRGYLAGHRLKRPRVDSQEQDHRRDRAMGLGQRSPESPLLDRNNGDQHGRDPGPTDSALTSRRSPSPETPHIQSRRTSRTSFVDLTDPSPERIKRQLSDSSIDELTPQAAGVYLTAVRFESRALISKEIIDGTNLYVRVSNQPDVAPAVINLRLCGDIQALFPVLVSECDIQATSTTKITKISVTFPWNGERLRLRKGRPEDWALFCTALRRRWQEHEVSDGAICKVEMLVHVDGQERGMES